MWELGHFGEAWLAPVSDDMVPQGWGDRMGPLVAPDNPNPDRKAGQIKRDLGGRRERHHPVGKDSPGPGNV